MEFPNHEEEHKLGEHRKEKGEEHPADRRRMRVQVATMIGTPLVN